MSAVIAIAFLVFISLPILVVGVKGPVRLIASIPVRKFLPSKTLRGSPEDLDPKRIALNLVITKMLRDIDSVTYTADRLSYSTNGISLNLYTTTFFSDNLWWISDGSIDFRINGESVFPIVREKNKTLFKMFDPVVQLKRKRVAQLAKEKENEVALKAIEFLTLGEKNKSDLSSPAALGDNT